MASLSRNKIDRPADDGKTVLIVPFQKFFVDLSGFLSYNVFGIGRKPPGGLTPKSEILTGRMWATEKPESIRGRLPDECAGGWRTTEKSVTKGEYVSLRRFCSPLKFSGGTDEKRRSY